MRLFFRQILLVTKKDLVIELREPQQFFSILLFGLLVMLLFSFALSADPDLMHKMAVGLFWLAVLFTSLLTLDHSFRKETEDGQWGGLLLLGIDPKALYLGKVAANLTFIVILEGVLLPLMAILYDLSLTPDLVIVLALGSLGIAALGTFYAGLTGVFREGQLLLPLLLLPMLVPVLLSSVKVMELTIAHDLFGQQTAWLKLLIVFDTLFLLGSLLFSDQLFDEI